MIILRNFYNNILRNFIRICNFNRFMRPFKWDLMIKLMIKLIKLMSISTFIKLIKVKLKINNI